MIGVEQPNRWYAAISNGDMNQLEALLAPDFVYRARPELPGGGTYRGRDVCMDRFRELRELFEPLQWSRQEFVEVGTRIMVVARLTGAGRMSGASVEEQVVHVWTMDDRG